MIQEFRDKVIKAAQKLQQQLADSAEQPALDGSGTDRADVQNDTAADEDLVLAHLKERHRKRATETRTEEQRPLAKPNEAWRPMFGLSHDRLTAILSRHSEIAVAS